MKFVVSKNLFQKYPDTVICVLIAAHIRNDPKDAAKELLEQIQVQVKQNFDINTLKDIAAISAWRKVYASFGSKPSEYRSSVEALIRSVLNGRKIPSINPLVDIYNYISLKYTVPVGGEDLGNIKGNLYLKFAEGNENFIPLNSTKIENPYRGEVIYSDDEGNIMCRRWNWRESDKTKITYNTRNAILVAEGFDSPVDQASNELSRLANEICGCNIKKFIVDKNNPEIEW